MSGAKKKIYLLGLLLAVSALSFWLGREHFSRSQKVDITEPGIGAAWLPDLALEQPENGIDPKEARDFWKNWRLVTTRYRADNKELRFVFANEIAWKTLSESQKIFPPGAMLGKLALNADHDKEFPVSIEPKTFSRIQLMKKMGTGYRSTDQWAYALYLVNPKKGAFAKKDAEACHGCHQIVSQRDFVFSKPAFLMKPAIDQHSFREQFRSRPVKDLKPKLFEFVKRQTSQEKIFTHTMPLFIGSLNESVVPLSRFASEAQTPYLLYDTHKEKTLTLALPMPKDPKCANKARVFVMMDRLTDNFVEQATYCNGTFLWEKPVRESALLINSDWRETLF